MKASLVNITVMIRKGADEDWPDAVAQAEIVEAVQREFHVIEINGPHKSGVWNFTLNETNQRMVVRRFNELIREHTEG